MSRDDRRRGLDIIIHKQQDFPLRVEQSTIQGSWNRRPVELEQRDRSPRYEFLELYRRLRVVLRSLIDD
jgi:hypothetical protein